VSQYAGSVIYESRVLELLWHHTLFSHEVAITKMTRLRTYELFSLLFQSDRQGMHVLFGEELVGEATT